MCFKTFQCHINSPAGELELSLSYDPWLGSLKVAIIKAKGLTCSICARKAHNSGIICVGESVFKSTFSSELLFLKLQPNDLLSL